TTPFVTFHHKALTSCTASTWSFAGPIRVTHRPGTGHAECLATYSPLIYQEKAYDGTQAYPAGRRTGPRGGNATAGAGARYGGWRGRFQRHALGWIRTGRLGRLRLGHAGH